jgi:gas vesicle protein
MPFLSTLITSAFEFQRLALEHSQEVLETSIDWQRGVNDTIVAGIEDQEDVQRRFLALQHVGVHRLCDRADDNLPAVQPATDELREVVDDQFSQLYDNHEEVFDTLVDELENSAEVYDDVSDDYLAAVDDQIEMLVDAADEFESQSIEAADQVEDRIEELRNALEDYREQLDMAQLGAAA